MTNKAGFRCLNIIRWIARISALLMAVLILLFFVGEAMAEGFEPLLHLSVRESLMMVAFVDLWLGLILGWRWELLGGLMTILGFASFYLLNVLFTGAFPRGPFFFILAAPSLLFLYVGLVRRRFAAE